MEPIDPSSSNSAAVSEYLNLDTPEQAAIQPTSPRSPETNRGAEGRAYRSRKNRPCDRCRRLKHRCDITADGPPCKQCTAGKRECTFDLEPPVRKTATRLSVGQESGIASIDRPPSTSTDEYAISNNVLSTPAVVTHSSTRQIFTSPDTRYFQEWDGLNPAKGGSQLPGYGPYIFHADPSVSTGLVTDKNLDSSNESGYDPYVVTALLTDDLIPVTSPNDETREHARQISLDPSKPIVMVMKPRPPHRYVSVQGKAVLAQVRMILSHHPLRVREEDLLSLYHSNIHTAMPILPEGPIESMPPELFAGVLAASLIASEPGRPLAMLVASMMENALSGCLEENISGIATALLMIGLRPQYVSRASSLLLARTICLAQILGLHIDPTRLAISQAEQDLRSRLWWYLLIQDSWMSLLKSRPSLIQVDNFSVPIPSLSSVLVSSCAYASASSDSAKSFIAMCKLALLARRLQSGVGTLGSSSRNGNERLVIINAIWDEAVDMRKEWEIHINNTSGRPNGVANLLLLLLGFRCLLKRLQLESVSLELRSADFIQVAEPFEDFVSLLERLNADEMRGYFLMNTQQILTLLMSSVIRLSLPDTSPMSVQMLPLLKRLVRQLNVLQSTSGADLTVHALNRAVNTSARFRSSGTHPALCKAIDDGLTSVGNGANPDDFLSTSMAVFQPPENDANMPWDWLGLDWTQADL